MPSLEKQEFTDALNQALMIKQIRPEANIGTGDERWERFQDIRGFDIKSYNIKTKQEKMREKMTDILETIKNFDAVPMGQALPTNQPTNEVPQQSPNQQ